MAAVFIPPSPQTTLQMATRRPPLANVPNAANSPHNGGFVPSKRPRTQGSQFDLTQCQPPAKKQLRDDENAPVRSPRKTISNSGEGKVFTRKNVNAPPTAFERKLVAAREKERQSQARPARPEKQTGNARDNLLQWQRHYRKAFPQFVFYFEGMSTEVHKKCSRQVHALGAVSRFLSFCSMWFIGFLSEASYFHFLIVSLRLIFALTERGEVLLSTSHPCCHCSSHSPGPWCTK